jgi:hypothetical protein
MSLFERPSVRRARREEAILAVLRQRPGSGMYGLFLCRESQLAPGVFFSVIERMVREGRVERWVARNWDAAKPGRTYYGLPKPAKDGAA